MYLFNSVFQSVKKNFQKKVKKVLILYCIIKIVAYICNVNNDKTIKK